jgi:hypothetical protein
MKEALFSAEAGREPDLRRRVPRKLPQWALLLVAYAVLLTAVWWLVR